MMDKKKVRQIYLARRKALSNDEFISSNNRISKLLMDTLPWQSLQVIHLFLPIPHQKEVNTNTLIDHIRHTHPHIQIVVPKIRPGSKDLDHYLLQESTSLGANKWGIPEPLEGQLIPVSKLDLVLVPLLAFDQYGHRVGYGKGFYDRFLAKCRKRTLKIGVSLFGPVDKIDPEPTDIPLTAVVTPKQVFNF